MGATIESQTGGGAAAPASNAAAPAVADPRPRATPPLPRAGEIIAPAVRIWLRYLVPLTLLSAIALVPLIGLALATRAPADAVAAKSVLWRGWALLALAWPFQLMLVGSAAAMTRAPGSQLRALGRGLVELVRAVAPCLVAAAAVAVGSLALVVPGVLLLVLLSLTGASRERGLPAPLLDSIAAARRQLPAVALTVAALFALDAAIGLVAHRAVLAAVPARPAAAQLAATRTFVRVIILSLVLLSPLPAAVLARLRLRLDPAPAPDPG